MTILPINIKNYFKGNRCIFKNYNKNLPELFYYYKLMSYVLTSNTGQPYHIIRTKIVKLISK